jgi:hypothetical protein
MNASSIQMQVFTEAGRAGALNLKERCDFLSVIILAGGGNFLLSTRLINN